MSLDVIAIRRTDSACAGEVGALANAKVRQAAAVTSQCFRGDEGIACILA
jgi:hypothetical protein